MSRCCNTVDIMSYVIEIFIVCMVFVLVRSEDIFCDYGVVSDDNVDVFTRNDLNFGESRDVVRNCLCNPAKCVYKCCPLDEELSNVTCQSSGTTHIPGLKKYVKEYLTLPDFDIIHHPIECFDAGMTRFIINPRNSYKAPATNFIITPDIDGMEQELQYFCVDFHREFGGYVGLICVHEIREVTNYGNTTGKKKCKYKNTCKCEKKKQYKLENIYEINAPEKSGFIFLMSKIGSL